jgi:hypothetical protein
MQRHAPARSADHTTDENEGSQEDEATRYLLNAK